MPAARDMPAELIPRNPPELSRPRLPHTLDLQRQQCVFITSRSCCISSYLTLQGLLLEHDHEVKAATCKSGITSQRGMALKLPAACALI